MLLNLFFPNRCQKCKSPLFQGVVCHRCQLPPSLSPKERCIRCFSPSADEICELCRNFPLLPTRVRYCWEYKGIIRELVRQAKYLPSLRVTSFLAAKVAATVPEFFPDRSWDYILPVPPSINSLQTRLCHPLLHFSLAISNEIGVPLAPYSALRHQGYKARQVLLRGEKRIRNVRRAFIAQPDVVEGKMFLITEDVITTGATIQSACRELLANGASEVDVLGISHSPAWTSYRFRVYKRYSEPFFLNYTSRNAFPD